MMVARPTPVLAISLTVLVLGLSAMLTDPSGIVSHFLQTQLGIWQGLGARGLTRPSWAPAAESGFLTAASAVTVFVLLRTQLRWAGLFALSALVIAFSVALIFARAEGIALDVLAPALVLTAVFAAGAGARFAQIRALKQDLRLAFADSLPRAAIEKIARDPSLLSLEGETRTITYLACGVRGLGELAVPFRDNPKKFTKLLEDILTPLMGQALQHGGVIDRLTSDGFTAYWNAPLDDAEHAAHACEAANGMMAAVTHVNENLAAHYRLGGPDLPPVEIGIGIANGPVIAGGFGGHGRLSYSVTGDAVRLASLLQIQSRNYGPAVIVTEETQQSAAQGFAFLEVDYVAQGPSDPPVRLYAMLDSRSARSSPKIRALVTFHQHIFQCFRSQQWDKARALVEQCSRLSGACQTLYELYLARIRYFESNPPGPDWDGAFRPILK